MSRLVKPPPLAESDRPANQRAVGAERLGLFHETSGDEGGKLEGRTRPMGRHC